MALNRMPIQIINQSAIYETDALLTENAPHNWNIKFLNMAIIGYSQLQPLTLLKRIKDIECTLSRKKKSQQWSPRTIDIDILFWGNKVIKHPDLTIPHLELHNRKFVLQPLCEIIPNYTHPVYKKNIKSLLKELDG